jgi:hypothetical protein
MSPEERLYMYHFTAALDGHLNSLPFRVPPHIYEAALHLNSLSGLVLGAGEGV